MKFTQTRAFIRHLLDSYPDHLSPIYILISSDGLGHAEALKTLSKLPGLEIVDVTEGQSLEQELLSQSLFSQKRALFVRQAELLKLDDKALASLVQKASGTPLFLCMQKLLVTTKVYKMCEKLGVVLDLNGSVKPWEKTGLLATWVLEQCKERGAKISHPAAVLLVEQVTDDKRSLILEIEKLLCYQHPELSIDEAAIRAVCLLNTQETVWQLGDALLTQKPKEALKALSYLNENEVSPIGWLRALRRQFQTHLELASLLEGGGGASEISTAFPSLKGQRLNTSLAVAKKRGSARLSKALVQIDRVEFETKNSSLPPELLTEMLIYKLL